MLGFLIPLLRWRTLLIIVGLAAVSALIWYLGPFIALFGTRPLLDESTRIYVIIGLFAAVLLIAVFRYWRARRANARMINKMMDSDGLMSLTETQSSEEVAILRERFEEALKILKGTRIGGKGSGLLRDLPWYIIIGPPGSGKTTILRNSGLDFPLAERVGADVLQGVGGTRNCDWWFTDEAVLLDTAGRYTTQDSNAVIDRAAWRSFLDMIKEFRPRRPLNGVLLAISLGDILTRNPEERAEHVEIFRRRLQELMRAFGLRLPVYLVITKCDLLAGFTEFFDDLNDTEREQLWGMTFTPAQADTSLPLAYNSGFSDLLGRVLERMQPRLHEERDAVRRRLIYTFPQQFGAIRELVGLFVNEVFRPNRYELAPLLRGVFFTSGTQEGTPIDRLLGAFSRAFGLGNAVVPPPSGKGRTFFVRQLLSDVVFAEADLVGTNRKLERRLAVTHAFGYVGAVVVAGLLGLLWFSSYSTSSAEAAAVQQRAQALAVMREHGPASTLGDFVAQLNAARSLSQFYDNEGFFSGFVERVGLSSSVTLAPLTQSLYTRMLSQELLPLMMARIRGQLAAAAVGDGPNARLHDMLALYLMLGDNSHFERPVVAAWMRADADAAFPLEAQRRADLWTHYQTLLRMLPNPQPLDTTLIASVRQRLLRIPQADAIYAQVRAAAERNSALPAFTFSQALGSSDTAFGPAGGTGTRTLIPGLYTRQGFYDGFIAKVPNLVRDQMQTDWVMGSDPASPSAAAAQDVIRQVADLYTKDYIAAWQLALSRISLIRWTSFDGLQTTLQTLIGPNRPLDKILQTLHTNTDLPRPDAAQQVPGATVAAGVLPTNAAKAVSVVASLASSAGLTDTAIPFPDPWPGDQIRPPFGQLTSLVAAPQGAQPPVARIDDQVSAVYAVINQIAVNEDPGAAALRYVSAEQRNQATDAASALRIEAATKPEPIRAIMLQVANSVAGTIVGGARQQVRSVWRTDITPVCEALIGGHYPFIRDGHEETPVKDFADFFRSSGTLDQFATRYAAGAAPAGAPGGGATPVAARPGAGGPAGPSPGVLNQIATGARIRAEFFAKDSNDPLVKFTITAVDLDPGLARATITIDGQQLVYRHDPPRAIPFQWPSQTDSSRARITLRDFKSEYTIVDQQGAWSLFRMFDIIGLQPTPRADTFTFTVSYKDMKATFRLTANSSTNPFTLADVRSFRCSDGN